VEDHLTGLGCKISFAGQAWSSNCRFWLYFDTFLDCEDLRKRFALDPCVVGHVNDDPRSGREKGLVCTSCHDGIMGRL
jgi:hypothetical protein